MVMQHYKHILENWPYFPKISDPFEAQTIDGKMVYFGDIPETVHRILSRDLARLEPANMVCLAFIGLMSLLVCYRVNLALSRRSYWRVILTIAIFAGLAVALT
jgi:hypothetical protein